MPSIHRKLHCRHRSRIQKRNHSHINLQFWTHSSIRHHRNSSGAVKHRSKRRFFGSYQQYSSVAFGAVIIVIGVTIIMKKFGTCTCTVPEPDRLGISKLTSRFDIRAFSMGFTRGLILCPHLVALLLYAVTFSQVDCTILAVLFGVGTALSPFLLLAGATGWLLNKAPLFSKWLSRIGGIALIVMGLGVLLGALLEIT